jgi:hypothetical protein
MPCGISRQASCEDDACREGGLSARVIEARLVVGAEAREGRVHALDER